MAYRQEDFVRQLYADGITEPENTNGDSFGDSRSVICPSRY